MKAVFAFLCISASAMAAISPLPQGYKAANTSLIADAKFDPKLIWIDSLGLGNDESYNWGRPHSIGISANGDTIKTAFDYGQLQHYLTIADTVAFAHPGMIVSEVDSTSGDVTFRYAEYYSSLTPSDSDFIEKLCQVYDVNNPALDRFGYTLTRENLDTANWACPERCSLYVTLPKKRKTEIHLPFLEGASDVESGMYSFHPLFRDDHGNFTQKYIKSDGIIAPMTGSNDLISYDIAAFDGDDVSWVITTNRTYPAGGCINSSTSYLTANIATGEKYGLKDLVINTQSVRLKQAYYESLLQTLVDDGWYNTDDLDAYEVLGTISSDSINDIRLPEEAAVGYGFIVLPYDIQNLIPFGELEKIWISVSMDKIRGNLKPLAMKFNTK